MVKCSRKTVSLSDIWVTSNDKLSDFYASSWQRGDSPIPLLVLRLLLSCVAVGILTWSIIESPSPYWLMFLTNWGLLFITTMMLSGLLVSVIAFCKTSYDTGELPWYTSLYWFMFNISVSIAFIITALYWTLLYNPETLEENNHSLWLDIATHGFNSCIALAELLLSRTPVRFLHAFQPLSVGLWYSAFTGIYYAAGGTNEDGNTFIYKILDWQQPQRAGTYVAIAMAGLLVIYTVVYALALCRDKISTSLVRTTSLDLPPVPPDPHMHTRIV